MKLSLMENVFVGMATYLSLMVVFLNALKIVIEAIPLNCVHVFLDILKLPKELAKNKNVP